MRESRNQRAVENRATHNRRAGRECCTAKVGEELGPLPLDLVSEGQMMPRVRDLQGPSEASGACKVVGYATSPVAATRVRQGCALPLDRDERSEAKGGKRRR
jgi:hypothetical protein